MVLENFINGREVSVFILNNQLNGGKAGTLRKGMLGALELNCFIL
jgi:hypothetical protein